MDIKERSECAIHITNDRPYVAVASLQGLFINQKLEEAEKIRIYEADYKKPKLIDIREIPGRKHDCEMRWKRLGFILKDCACLLVHDISNQAQEVLIQSGLQVYRTDDFVEKILMKIGQK